MGVSEGEQELYGIVVINLNTKKVYVQWSFEPNPDWSRGEDLVFTSPEDAEKITETFKDVCVENVEVGEDGSITLWLRSKI
jgi:hypothetical protein